MLIMVVIVSAGVVGLVYLLGGNNPLGDSEPIIVVVTSPATATNAPTATPNLQSSPTVAPESGGPPLPTFALEGPTLPPVVLSPTPDVISIGRSVRIINVGEGGLNVRSAAGIDNPIVFTAPEDSLLTVIDGPITEGGDGFTWWQVRDTITNETGWAVQLYMDVQPETTS